MREKPNLADAAITHCLREGYGLGVARLAFLPVGNDAAAWAYRADAQDGSAYFVKVKRGPVYASSVVVPHFLKEQGLLAVVAPLPARTLTGRTRSIWLSWSQQLLSRFYRIVT